MSMFVLVPNRLRRILSNQMIGPSKTTNTHIVNLFSCQHGASMVITDSQPRPYYYLSPPILPPLPSLSVFTHTHMMVVLTLAVVCQVHGRLEGGPAQASQV